MINMIQCFRIFNWEIIHYETSVAKLFLSLSNILAFYALVATSQLAVMLENACQLPWILTKILYE